MENDKIELLYTKQPLHNGTIECQNPDCSVIMAEVSVTTERKYCSKTCRWKARHGKKKRNSKNL